MSEEPLAERELTVGQVAERSGVAVSALHFYESQGLISSRRTTGNQRRYPREILRRAAFIRASQRVGIPLRRIKAALDLLPENRTRPERTGSACRQPGATTSTSTSRTSNICGTDLPDVSAVGASPCRAARSSTPTTYSVTRVPGPAISDRSEMGAGVVPSGHRSSLPLSVHQVPDTVEDPVESEEKLLALIESGWIVADAVGPDDTKKSRKGGFIEDFAKYTLETQRGRGRVSL